MKMRCLVLFAIVVVFATGCMVPLEEWQGETIAEEPEADSVLPTATPTGPVWIGTVGINNVTISLFRVEEPSGDPLGPWEAPMPLWPGAYFEIRDGFLFFGKGGISGNTFVEVEPPMVIEIRKGEQDSTLVVGTVKIDGDQMFWAWKPTIE